MQCLKRRELKGKEPDKEDRPYHHKGDQSYVLMGLLRVRPRIDSEDSLLQVFAR